MSPIRIHHRKGEPARSRALGVLSLLSLLTLFALCGTPVRVLAQGNTDAGNVRQGTFLLVNTTYPPYAMPLEGGGVGGMGAEFAENLFHRLSIPIRQRLLPWNRVLHMMETGAADGVTVLAYSAEREASMVLTVPISEARQSLYYSRSNHYGFAWQQYEDLLPHRIGLVQGYAYSPEFLKAVGRLGLAVEYAPTDESNFAKLRTGRVDLCLSNDLVADAYLGSHPALQDAVGKADGPVHSYPQHMAFSRRSPLAGRLPEINAEIERMRNDGTLARIFSSGREQHR